MRPEQALIDFKPTKEYLVAVDSDGCAIDAMDIKQMECFCPMMIAYFGLQPVAKAARECKVFADLRSRTRGENRHKTMARILSQLLPSHPIVRERNFNVPAFTHYLRWVSNPNNLLSGQGLQRSIESSSNLDEKKELEIVLKWSRRVNEMVAEVVKNVPPFQYVRQSLETASRCADIIVCSATPTEALKREWAEHGLLRYVKLVAGQEMGNKAQHLAILQGKYDAAKVLMIGDAPGDLKAAQVTNVLFYPITPGSENESWAMFYREAFSKFIDGDYCGNYQNALIAKFEKSLLEYPDWQKGA